VTWTEKHGKVDRVFLCREGWGPELMGPAAQTLYVDLVALEARRAEVEVGVKKVREVMRDGWSVVTYPNDVVVVYRNDRVYGVKGKSLGSGNANLALRPKRDVLSSVYVRSVRGICRLEVVDDWFVMTLPPVSENVRRLLADTPK
jgi:hypothetical protein